MMITPANAAKPNCGGLRTGTGAIITHAPSTMHQIAMLIGSFEPSGRGASADTMNKIQEEMVARMVAAGFLLSRGKASVAGAFGRQLGPASCATGSDPGLSRATCDMRQHLQQMHCGGLAADLTITALSMKIHTARQNN